MRFPNGTLPRPLSPPTPTRAHDAEREATTTPPKDPTPPPPPQVVVLPPQLTKDTSSEPAGKFLLVSKGACHLTNFHVTNISAADRYLQLFDAPELPRNGAKPRRSYLIPASSTYEWDAPHGRYCGNGCILALSSTLAELTIATADDGMFDASFFRPL